VIHFDPAALERLVARSTGSAPTAVEEMPGGASTRRYLRVRGPFGALVAMFVPDAAPEEATTASASATTRWPFLEVRDLLAARGVRVPRVVGEACDHGLVLLEDLGDVTLGAFVEARPAERAAVYRRAVEDLARAQATLVDLPAGSIVATRAFDAKLLRWELEHFREWALEARGKDLPADERAAFGAAADALADEIASWPRGFTHRDYQSRNLMVVGATEAPELVWIDFQDALLGPKVYDLVALLNDSYVDIDQAFIDARLDEYAKAAGLDERGREELGRAFDRLTVQRKMKDAGRFIFIDRKKNNPAFLPYFEPSLAKVRRSLARLGDDAVMRTLARAVDRV
jgi:N-acetylmuramate 1-kinase